MNKEQLLPLVRDKYTVFVVYAVSSALIVYFTTKVVFVDSANFNLLFCGGIILIIACLIRNELVLYALIILVPYHGIFSGNMFGVKGVDPANIMYIASLLFMFMILIKNPEKRYLNKGIAVLIVLFISIEFIAWVRYFYVNEYNEASMKNWVMYFIKQAQIISLYFIFAICIQNRKTAKNLVYFTLGFILIVNICQITNFIGALLAHKFFGMTHTHTTLQERHIEELGYLRVINPFMGVSLKEHSYLLIQIIPLPIMIYYTSLKNKITKLFALIITASSFVCILLAQTRTVYLGLFVGVLYLAIFVERRLRKHLLVGLMSIIVLASLGLIYYGRFSAPQAYESLDVFSGGRLYIWKCVFQLLADNPLVALIGGGKAFFEREGVSYLKLVGYSKDIHNAYLAELVNKGVIGLLIFVYFIYYTIKNQTMFQKSNDDTFYQIVSVSIVFNVVAAIAMCLFGGITFPGTEPIYSYTWLFLGITSMAGCNRQ